MGMRTTLAEMVFNYARFGGALPDAYERLLLDAIHGDATLFARKDEIEVAWGIVGPLLRSSQKRGRARLHLYEKGSWGPTESDEFIGRDRRSWQVGCAADVRDST